MNDFAEIISLLLTTPAIFLSIMVLWYWRHETREALDRTHVRDATGWLVLGVTISFAGSIVDNLYWGVAWGADYIGHPSRDFWFRHGVWPNVPFRQISLLVAAYCHLRGALVLTPNKHHRVLKKMLWTSFVVGAAIVLILTVVKIAYY